MFKRSSKAQSTLEYVVLIGFVVAALIAMGIYMKRGIQGKLRESTDQVGEQYSAYYTSGEYTINRKSDSYETMSGAGGTTTTWGEPANNYEVKWGSETVEVLNKE